MCLVKDNTVFYIKAISKLFKITDVLYKTKTWYLVKDKKKCGIKQQHVSC